MNAIWDVKSCAEFLNSYIKGLPKKGYGEAKRIAEYLGVSSTYISQVLSSERTLSVEQAQALGQYLGLETLEFDYWMTLVQFEKSGTQTLRDYFQANLLKIKEQALMMVNRIPPKRKLTDEEKSIFYSSGLYSVVHLYCSIDENGASLDSIIKKFEIPRKKAIEIIRFLTDCGLLKEENGFYQLGVQSTHTGNDSPHLLKHHSNWRIKAIQASESLDTSELMYTVQVTLSQNDFLKLREEMVIFIKNFLDRVHASPAEEIACFNMDWFRYRS